MEIQTTKYGEPILGIVDGVSGGKPTKFGVYRDRQPDRDWGEIIQKNMETGGIETRTLTPELKLRLLGDLAYVYGNKTEKFEEKVKEFKLI